MSIKSQETNMRRLAGLLSQDLGYIYGEKECGPNGAKKTFLRLGNVFLLAKDHSGGHYRWISVADLEKLSYQELLSRLSALRKSAVTDYERAA